MYLSKNSVISLFFQMRFLYFEKDIRKQGGTQFFSELRYFLALDEFVSAEKRNCNTADKDDKQKFIKYVGHVVQLSDSDEKESCDTKNFFDSFGNNDDFDVGSNFFSTVVKGSENSKKLYPKKSPLILCEKLQIGIAKNAYALFANDKSYLDNNENFFALLFLWLNRRTDISNKLSAYNDFLAHLKKSYSQEMIRFLKWESDDLRKIINEYLDLLDFEETAVSLNKDCLIFDELDEKQVKKLFSVYLVANCPSSESSLRSHYVEICETTLGKKLKDSGNGDIFRYKNPEEYKNEYRRIKKIKGEDALNAEDRIVLDLYQDFLDSMPYNPNRWQYLLEKLARQKNLLMSIDSSGNRVVVQNDFILVVDAYSLYTCFKNEKFSLYQEQVKRMLESNTKWLLCKAQEEIPDKPHSNKEMMKIFESDDDKCLYIETHDSTEFETLFDELVGLLTRTKGQFPNSKKQIIYYGVPGSGKSNKIREDLKNVPEKNKIRVVFHPEYTNAEFIGQILPVTNGGIRYEFTPGPFTQIIKRAYLNPNEQFYLVIEEINRGNAAAIFGDTFQLLDRLKAGETDSLGNDPANAAVNTFTEGWSQYFVQNDDVNAYIRKATKLDDGSYQERNDGEPIEEIKIKEIHFNANTAIRLPPNLSILATMNTSDQNVFTLDNAFQRRFDMELVRNEFDLTQPAVNAQYNAEIDDTGIKWGQFWGWINAKITATLKGLSSTEDKRLGVWFVSNVGGIIDDKVFAEKVLKFLWDDAFKFKRPQIFADGIDTLEKLINFFEKPSEGKERFDVFKDKANLVAFVASPTL